MYRTKQNFKWTVSLRIKESSLKHKNQFSIPRSLQPYDVHVKYFKLRFFNSVEFIF